MNIPLHLIEPECFESVAVRACFTTRLGGCSAAPFAGLTLALHVGDDPTAVALNRAKVQEKLGLQHAPCWLDQKHGNRVVRIDEDPGKLSADASITRTPGLVCVVMVADCVPLLLCDRGGTEVAAIHAGWRGLETGVIDATLDAFTAVPSDIIAWLGPSIGLSAYQIGADLRRRFAAADPGTASAFDRQGPSWYMDLAHLARGQLEQAGVEFVHIDGHCVYQCSDLFYSYRRDGRTGRMAALIWIEGS